MKIKLLALLVTFSLSLGMQSRAQQTDTYFPYPVVPDELTSLSGRCNYLVDHFWERCNLKQSFSALDRLDKAFGDWISFMPYATTDTIFPAIDRFLTDVAKTGADNLSSIGKMAQKYIYCDSAEYYSEDLYLPFCRALANNKKLNKAERARYEAQLKILESSGLGQRVPNLTLTAPDGSKINLDDVVASRVVIFFNDPDCFDCTLAKARLSADYNLNTLVDNGLVKVVSIYPGDPDEQWRTEAAKYPANWVVGALPNADEYFVLDDMPVILYLDARHKVLGKNVNLDNLFLALRQINQQMQQ